MHALISIIFQARNAAMFCAKCGTEAEDSAKFCCKCGQCLAAGPSKSSIGFEEFKRRREDDRRWRFEPKMKLKKTASSAGSYAGKPKSKEVTINIGFMKYCDGVLKRCRGKTLPIQVPPSASAEIIKTKAVRKHTNHDKSLHVFWSKMSFGTNVTFSYYSLHIIGIKQSI